MKKILVFTLIIILSLTLVSCRPIDEFFTDKSKLEELSFIQGDGEKRDLLIWQDKEYEPYKTADSRLKGGWFGIIKNEEAMRVYFCNEQNPEEWLVVLGSTFMGGYVLYKEVSITEIPEEIEDYEFNK